jgi:hypothetical protein
MAGRDPYLTRINRALRNLGSSVTLEVSPSGGRMRLRASLPLPDGSWKQRRISTAFPYPSGVDRSLQLTGFVKELWSWKNFLQDRGLRFEGDPDQR